MSTRSSCTVLSCLFVLTVLLGRVHAAPTSENVTCLFEGCACTNTGGKIDVICVARQSDIVKPNYFPARNLSSDITVIHNLLMSYYNFQTVPADAFNGLTIKNLLLIGNGLTYIGANSFRGVKNLSFLLVNDRALKQIGENSTAPIRDTLVALDLSDSALDVPMFESLLPELKKLGQLTTLMLNFNSLANISSKHLSLFPNLKRFSLMGNNLTEIQDQKLFQNNTQLSNVDLSKNKFKDLANVLPILQQIESTLTQLSLDSNQLLSVQEIRLSKLQKLRLSNNQISTISASVFTYLTDLRYLDLSGNKLTAFNTAILKPATKLSSLSLANNQMSTIPDISNMTELMMLDLSNQNGQLQLQDYAFNRLSSANSMEINLNDNQLAGRITDKAFCSRSKRTSDLKSISINYDTIKSINVCMLRELRQDSTMDLVVTGTSSTSNYDACNCNLENYASASNVNLTGICDQYTSSCQKASIVDLCAVQFPQYTCSSSALRQSLIILISLLALALLI